MANRENIINDLNVAKRILCNPQALTFEMKIRIGQAITNAINMLKDRETISGEMTNKEMADFLLELRNRQEMPIDGDEYYLIGDIADRLMADVDIEPTESLERK